MFQNALVWAPDRIDTMYQADRGLFGLAADLVEAARKNREIGGEPAPIPAKAPPIGLGGPTATERRGTKPSGGRHWPINDADAPRLGST